MRDETYNFNGHSWNVSAQFTGEDAENRKFRVMRIVRKAENELDALITQKRAELEANICLLCDELNID